MPAVPSVNPAASSANIASTCPKPLVWALKWLSAVWTIS
jgi:hypothetical protein